MKRYNHQIAASLQSRLSKRGREIAEMEGHIYLLRDALRSSLAEYGQGTFFAREGFKVLRSLRKKIRPLAQDQKLDREALAAVHELMRMGFY
jgi:hypothetical protein